MNCDGNVIVPAAREMVTRPSFQRLAQRLQNSALELRQFVQKQNTVVRERNFAGRRIDVATEQTLRRWQYGAARETDGA